MEYLSELPPACALSGRALTGLRATFRRRCGPIDGHCFMVEDHAIIALSRFARDIALPDIVLDRGECTLLGRAEAAAAARADHDRIARATPAHEELGVRAFFPLIFDTQRHPVAFAGETAFEAPGLALRALDPRVDGHCRQSLDAHLDAQSAAIAPGTTAVLAQAVVMDEDREFGFEL